VRFRHHHCQGLSRALLSRLSNCGQFHVQGSRFKVQGVCVCVCVCVCSMTHTYTHTHTCYYIKQAHSWKKYRVVWDMAAFIMYLSEHHNHLVRRPPGVMASRCRMAKVGGAMQRWTWTPQIVIGHLVPWPKTGVTSDNIRMNVITGHNEYVYGVNINLWISTGMEAKLVLFLHKTLDHNREKAHNALMP